MFERIEHKSKIIAIIIYSDFTKEGLEFFTPNDFSQQLAYMKHPAGKQIVPHTHNRVPREISYTLETLFVKSGKVKVDLYDSDQNFVTERILSTGDTILLASGGHGFTMLETTEMIEVKQGPYPGEDDKIRFKGNTP